jgi:hypothetical protein
MDMNYAKVNAQSLNMAKTPDMGGALRMGYENSPDSRGRTR